MLSRLIRSAVVGLSAVTFVFTSQTDGQVSLEPGAVEMDSDMYVEIVPGDARQVEEEAEEGKSQEFIVAPLPSRNSLLGWVIAVPAVSVYRPNNASEGDGPWTTGVAGYYAANESWGAGAFHKMSIDGDRWRFMGTAFYTDVRYMYYGVGGEDFDPVPLRQPTSFVMAEGLREVANGLYLGLRGSYAVTDVQYNGTGEPLPPGASRLIFDENLNLVTLSPRLNYDTRDNEFYPSEGYLIEGTVRLGLEGLGSDLDYQILELKINHYQELGSAGVLALRGVTKYAADDAPFFFYPAFGQGADLRGYTTGTYRDRFLIAVQAEYRHRFTESIGAVVFGGVGSVAPEFAGWETTLPSVGFGFRYVIAKANNISVRVDFAWGRDDHQFYLGLREAF